MSNLIIIRHGQSGLNTENLFTGSNDTELTPAGEIEAQNAGRLIKKYPLDEAYTSVLVRAVHTLAIVLKEIDKVSIQVTKSACLNERSYGDLQGMNKLEMVKKYGPLRVQSWKAYDAVPPGGESLKDTYNRVVPYYTREIEPKLRAGKNIIIVAHGNSLRALMMYLEKISETKIVGTNLASGVPRLYEFDSAMVLSRVGYIH